MKRIATVLLVVGVLVLLDLWSKAAVFAWMEPLERAHGFPLDTCGCNFSHPRHVLAGDWFALMLNVNPGAAFGQLDSVPYLLISGRVAAALFLLWLIVFAKPGRRVFNAAIVLVFAGTLGNLYDNLLRPRTLDHDLRYVEHPFGPVRDFIDVYFASWQWHFPTFNLADSYITVGAVLLLATGLFTKSSEPEPAGAPRG